MSGRSKGDPTGFGVRLKALREAAGLSQRALAEAAGMNVFGVAKLEQGAREPAWSTVMVLATALGVSCEAFGPGSDGVPPSASSPATRVNDGKKGARRPTE